MVEFKPNTIFSDAELMAEEIIEARLKRQLNLRDVSKKIKIRHKYLKAIETCEFYKLPPGVYGRSYLKEYAQFLGLDYENYLNIFEKELLDKGNIRVHHFDKASNTDIRESLLKNDKIVRNSGLFSAQRIRGINFIIFPKIIKALVVMFVVFACFTYLGFYLKNVLSPPNLNLAEPHDNMVTVNNFVNVIGTADPETEIIVNGETVLSDENGSFTIRINLKKGINSISVIAKKKYGRETSITRQILVK